MNPWRDLAGREQTFTENYTDSSGSVWDATARTLDTGGVTLDVVDLRRDGETEHFYTAEHTKTGFVIHYTVGELHGDIDTLTPVPDPDDHPVSVAFLIGRNGVIYRLWEESGWAAHVGAGLGNAGNAIDMRTIAVELTNMGPLTADADGVTLNNDWDKEYCTLAESDGYDDYLASALHAYYTQGEVAFEGGEEEAYRGTRYFASFTDAQYVALQNLIRYLTHAYSIVPTFRRVDEAPEPPAGQPKQRLGRYEAFQNDGEADAYVGISSHVNWRREGKWDVGPTFDWRRLIYGFPVDIGGGYGLDADNVAAYYRHTEAESEGGTYPIGANTIWHGGVHLRVERGSEVRACAPGVVVAARLVPDEGTAWGAFGSTNFILVRHDGPNEEFPSLAVPADDQPHVWYSLYMHLETESLEAANPRLTPLTWLSDGTGAAPHEDLLELLRGGQVVSPMRYVGGGAPLWWAGEIGEEDARQGGIHWEVFSEVNLRPTWPWAKDPDHDLTCDPAAIFDLIPQPGWAQDPWNVDAEEIQAYYRSDKCVEMRTIATHFCSEWGLDLEATLDRLRHRFEVGDPADYDPYLWWPEVDAELPADRRVWHYNPIAFLETVETTDAVSQDSLPAQPSAPTDGSHRGTLTGGMLFDTNKTFLLPSALGYLQTLKRFYDEHPGFELLLVGHADRSGEGEYNRVLSEERAAAMSAFLQDDAPAWLAWFSEGSSKQWGTREDQHMLSALSDDAGPFFSGEITGVADAATSAAVERFQAWANTARGASLVVDGVSGPNTRAELVPAYMAIDETTLPAGTVIHTHGCGEYHPALETADGVSEAQNRRVEAFFFTDGVAPLPQAVCPGPDGCPEHHEWLLSVIDEIELDDPAPEGPATAVTFTCEKIITQALETRATPMAWCWVYAFEDQGGELVRVAGNDPPPQTEADGSCPGLELTPGETYHLYFAGKALTPTQVTDLTGRRRNALVEVTAPDDNRVHLPQSFSWWIALLHHVEAVISDPEEVLTRVRKLYYNDRNWNQLINRGSIPALYTWDEAGLATNTSGVELEVLMALGKIYERSAPDRFTLDDDGLRTIEDRHDFVILPGGREIQISHTLTGMESYRFGPAWGPAGDLMFPYPHSATTWAGDLGQAVDEAVARCTQEAVLIGEWSIVYPTLLDDYPHIVEAAWAAERDDKARFVELHGDVHGVVIGGAIEATFSSLSEILEEYLCNPARDTLAKAWWIEAYADQGVTTAGVQARTIHTADVRVEVEEFAETFDWNTGNFDQTRAVDRALVDWSLQHMCDALNDLAP